MASYSENGVKLITNAIMFLESDAMRIYQFFDAISILQSWSRSASKNYGRDCEVKLVDNTHFYETSVYFSAAITKKAFHSPISPKPLKRLFKIQTLALGDINIIGQFL